MRRIAAVCLITSSNACLAQPVPTTAEELSQQTKLLKAQQDFYDQQAATLKSQKVAADAATAAETASLTTNTQLKNAQFANDLALANALKAAGLSAATGKEGVTTIAKAESTLLAFQGGSLAKVSGLAKTVCQVLTKELNGAHKAFIAPADYEKLVQKSIPDVVQLYEMQSTAAEGLEDYEKVKLASVSAVAGALMSAQYIAGSVQALSKLFRSDYAISYTATNRQLAFEQMLSAGCPAKIESNMEGRLRLNAATLLRDWIRDIAKFVEMNDASNEVVTQQKAYLSTQRAAYVADAKLSDDEKAKFLKPIDEALGAMRPQEQMLARYKHVATAMKTYLAALSTNTALYESMVWGQDHLRSLSAFPVNLDKVEPSTLARFNYTLTVQDASVKATSFFSEKWRTFSTVELTYAVTMPDGKINLAGALSSTAAGDTVEIKKLAFSQVDELHSSTTSPAVAVTPPQGTNDMAN